MRVCAGVTRDVQFGHALFKFGLRGVRDPEAIQCLPGFAFCVAGNRAVIYEGFGAITISR